MARTYLVNTLVAAAGMIDNIFNSTNTNATKEECCADLTGAQGPVDLIVDTGGVSSDITVTVHGGDGPTSPGDRKYIVPSGHIKCIPISTGETMCSDGKFYFDLEGKNALNLERVRTTILAHRNVDTH